MTKQSDIRKTSVAQTQIAKPFSSPMERGRDNLFFAVFPEPHAVDDIIRRTNLLRARHGLKGRSLGADRLHVSVQSVGRFETVAHDIIARAREAATYVTAPAFDVEFNRVMSFGKPGRRNPVVLLGDEGVIGFTLLRRKLHEAMRKTGLGGSFKTALTPHITLLYDDRHVAEASITPVSWRVRDLVLVHSLVGQTRYVPLGRWRLQDLPQERC